MDFGWWNDHADHIQDPEVQKFTGKTERVEVMAALREAKNSM
jgi:hydroxyacylglutathione hydrolase